MAENLRYVCGNCRRAIEAWSDGNPYYLDAAGAKQYAYHPDPEVDQCVGNDVPHICLACGSEFVIDSLTPVNKCPQCGSAEIADCFDLAGRRCPYCRVGVFTQDQDFSAIS